MPMNKPALGFLSLAFLLTACQKAAIKPNFTSAINTYYAAQAACLWAGSVRFPEQVTTSDQTKTAPYDALVDQGLLTRTTAEKKELLILTKQVTNYDLSAKGRAAWTPDTQQPGAGNFCYGTPKVTSVDAYTPTDSRPGATTTVNYHVEVTGAPSWATAAETQNAFPGVATAVSAPSAAQATLTDTTSGWSVTSGPGRRLGTPAE